MEKEQLITLVRESQAGDSKAIEKLLQYAHTPVSYQCRKMLKHPQDAEDLTQEVLVTIYTKLDTLQEPAAFHKWVNQITASRCINVLNRTHVEYQFVEDEEGHSKLDALEELDEQVIPDKAIDNAETARMIEEIVQELPDAQRAATLMFYYGELSVKELAKTMNVSENTVKSRLNYARKAIKERVLDYEKQGIKLYGLSPLPFLLYFLRLAAQNSADKDAAVVMAKRIVAVQGSAVGAAALGAAAASGGTVTGGIFAGFAAKATAVILAAAIAVGGYAVVTSPNLQNDLAKPSTVTTESAPTEFSETSQEAEYEVCGACGEGQILPVDLTQDPCADRLEVAFRCDHCGFIAGYSNSPGNGHTYGISDDGQYEICTVCGKVLGPTNIGHGGVTEEAAHTHSYDTAVTDANCTTGGHTTYTCACGHNYEDNPTDALGHDWILAVPNEPSCGIDGSNYYHCTRAGCDADYTEVLPKTGHNWSNWKVTSEPTTEYAGEEMRECLNKQCDAIQTRTIPKLSSDGT